MKPQGKSNLARATSARRTTLSPVPYYQILQPQNDSLNRSVTLVVPRRSSVDGGTGATDRGSNMQFGTVLWYVTHSKQFVGVFFLLDFVSVRLPLSREACSGTRVGALLCLCTHSTRWC